MAQGLPVTFCSFPPRAVPLSRSQMLCLSAAQPRTSAAGTGRRELESWSCEPEHSSRPWEMERTEISQGKTLCNLLTHSLQRLGMEQGMLFLPWELEPGSGRMCISTVTVWTLLCKAALVAQSPLEMLSWALRDGGCKCNELPEGVTVGLLHTEHHGYLWRARTCAGQGGIGIWMASISEFLRAFSIYHADIHSCGTFNVQWGFVLSLNSVSVILSSKIRVIVNTQGSLGEDRSLVRW